MSMMNLTADTADVSPRDRRVLTNGNVILPANEVNTYYGSHTSESTGISTNPGEQPALFDARFARCHQILRFLAGRVLGISEQVHEVVENCRITASRNPPTFEYEGAFRSWLVRILIDEALLMVRQRRCNVTNVGTSLDRTQPTR